MDTSKPGRVVAALMEDLAKEYDGQDDVEIGTVLVVVEVRSKDVDVIFTDEDWEEEDSFACRVHLRSNDGRHWIQAGLLDYAKAGLIPNLGGEDDEE